MSRMEGFAGRVIETRTTSIFVAYAGSGAGSGPPLLLLHGFPQTHLMWREVASQLASHFTVVCADLRGYGRSGCPQSSPDHLPYSKRVMGQDMVDVMQHLGFEHFSVAGHDRGGRVAYRMALDHPKVITRLAVLDIVPTETASVSLMICGSNLRSTGQSRIDGPDAILLCGERHVHLDPQQESETIELLDGQITFLTPVRFTMVLPFGQNLDMVLPAGTNWPIPDGKYKLANPTDSPIDFVLRRDVGCKNNSPH